MVNEARSARFTVTSRSSTIQYDESFVSELLRDLLNKTRQHEEIRDKPPDAAACLPEQEQTLRMKSPAPEKRLAGSITGIFTPDSSDSAPGRPHACNSLVGLKVTFLGQARTRNIDRKVTRIQNP